MIQQLLSLLRTGLICHTQMFPKGKETDVTALKKVIVLPADPAAHPEKALGWGCSKNSVKGTKMAA